MEVLFILNVLLMMFCIWQWIELEREIKEIKIKIFRMKFQIEMLKYEIEEVLI